MYNSAAVTQGSIDGIDKEWVVISDKGIELYALPANLDAKNAMAVLHFARFVETNSLKQWAKDQMVKSQKQFESVELTYQKEIARLTKANERLTEKLANILMSNEI